MKFSGNQVLVEIKFFLVLKFEKGKKKEGKEDALASAMSVRCSGATLRWL